MSKPLMERFMKYVGIDWQWLGSKDKDGYGQFSVGVRGERKMKKAHRVSYELFNGPIPDGALVLHACDDPGCVNPKCLHLGTVALNAQESVDRGRWATNFKKYPGSSNNKAKLTEAQVLEIRALAAGGKSRKEIGEMYGVSAVSISYIVLRRTWTHL